MSEVVNFKKHEKARNEYVKENFGIETSDPLSPEYLRGTYDSAFKFNEGMHQTAEQAEEQTVNHGPEGQSALRRSAEQYRANGRAVLEGTLRGATKYVGSERVSSAYIEQAHADMEHDLSQQKAA